MVVESGGETLHVDRRCLGGRTVFGEQTVPGFGHNDLPDGRRTIISGLANVHVGPSVGSEKSVPEEVNHRKVGVRVQMMDEVKLLFAPKPSEP